MSAAECISSANELLAAHSALIDRIRQTQRAHRRQLRALASPPHDILNIPLIPSPPPSPPSSCSPSPTLPPKPQQIRSDLPPAKRARTARYENYVPEEETIRNDYSQRYVDSGDWPQNWVLGADPERRFEEYPKQQRLLALKKASVAAHALPPTYLPFSELSSLQPSKFDVILIDPPFSSSFTWDDLQNLPIPALSADPSFLLVWVGSGVGEGLERGREIMAKWGFRRCEDIVWVKTNKTTNRGPGTDPPTTSVLTRTKQHCLMGIRGTVRRSTDSWFVHCNVDTDVLIWEGDATDPTLKPPEMYTLIENFCLGLRKLEIFGRARTLRKGWVSALAEGEEAIVEADNGEDHRMAADDETPVHWDREAWEAKMRAFAQEAGGKFVVPMTPEIDALRPKSPVRGQPNLPGGTSAPGHGHAVSSGMATPMSMGRGGGSFNPPPPRMMGPPIMLGGVNQMGGMGQEAMGLGMQNMGWGDPNAGMGGGMGVGVGGMGVGGMGVGGMGVGGMGVGGMGVGGMSVGMGAQGMGMNGLGGLGNLGNIANLGTMNGMMGQFSGGGGGGGFDGGMGGWEGGEMMGHMGMPVGAGMGGMGMGGMSMHGMNGMNNAMGLNGMNAGMGMNPGMNMNTGMGMGGGVPGMGTGMNMGGAMGNMGMGMGMGMNQWRGR